MISLSKSHPGSGTLCPALEAHSGGRNSGLQERAVSAIIRCDRSALIALLVMLGSIAVKAQTIFIGADQYAFQYQPSGAPLQIGLYFNATQSRYEFRDALGGSVLSINPVADFSLFRGNLGVGLTSAPTVDFEVAGQSLIRFAGSNPALEVRGNTRLGGATQYTNISNTGVMSFVGGAFLQIDGDSYAFQATGSSNGLYFNQTDNRYEFHDNAGVPVLSIGANGGSSGDLTVDGQSWFRNRVGIGTSAPSTDLHVAGNSQFGGASNFLEVDISGNLSLSGSANYLVKDDSYAFRYIGSDAGLLFSTTDGVYRLTADDGAAVMEVSVGVGTTGDALLTGDLNVNGSVRSGSDAGLARISATSTTGAELAAVRGEGLEAGTFGYLGVQGDSTHDGTSLDIRNDEIGVLGIALDAISGTTDDYGVYGYSSHVGVRGESTSGFYTELGTPGFALRVVGPASFSETIEVDSFKVLSGLHIDETTKFDAVTEGPFVLGSLTGNRLNLDRNSIQARSISGPTLLEVNPLGGNINMGNGGGNVNIASTGTGVVTIGSGGGNVNIGNGGAVVNIASTGGGSINLATGGGNVNISDILHTDYVDERVGIGVVDPAYTLTIKHPTGTLSRNGLALINSLTNTTWHLYSFTDGDLGLFESDSLKGRFDNVSGMYMVTSDRRLKVKVREMGSVLDQVMDLQPRRYRYRSEEGGKRDYYGFVAQEVEGVFPDLVAADPETGIRAVSYTELVPVSLAAIQEQQLQIEEQSGAQEEMALEIDELQGQLQQALNRIGTLESMLTACCSDAQSSSGQETESPSRGWIAEVSPNPSSGLIQIRYFLSESASLKARMLISDQAGQVQDVINNLEFGQVSRSYEFGQSGQYVIALEIDGQVVDAQKVVIQ